jgi:enoyl-CoA hydratase/carnithine racemase
MRALPGDDVHSLFALCCGVMRTILEIPQPVIASVRGIATAAGCQLVATCDLAVAEEGARFATSGINVGLFCSTPGVALSRNVARKRAFELLSTGDFIDAATACEWGLINRVVPPAELEATTLDLAHKIAAKSAATVSSGKRMFYRQLEMSLQEAYEHAAYLMARDMAKEDAAEGIDAFLAKRKPSWRDR